MAGSQRPWSRDVEISTDNGTTFQHLPLLPYGDNEGVDYPCVAIINDTTVFIAGGRSEGWVRQGDRRQLKKRLPAPISDAAANAPSK